MGAATQVKPKEPEQQANQQSVPQKVEKAAVKPKGDEMMEMLRGIQKQNKLMRKEISDLKKQIDGVYSGQDQFGGDHHSNDHGTDEGGDSKSQSTCPLAGQNIPASQC